MVQITQFLRRAVQTRTEHIATECEARARTWREFEGRVAALAGALAALGYKPGDRIGMLALNSDRYLEYFFAMAWGGFVFVPINTRLAPPEIAFWLTDSGCSGLFIDDAFFPALGDFRPHAPGLRHIVRVGGGDAPPGILAFEDLVAPFIWKLDRQSHLHGILSEELESGLARLGDLPMAHMIDKGVARGSQQPGLGILRHAVARPSRERCTSALLRASSALATSRVFADR